MINPAIFREYDIRGVVGKDFTGDFALSLGRAFGAYLKGRNPAARKVSVGKDARLSSSSLAEDVIRGILSTGLDVCDIGMCPTPLQYFSIHHLDLDGGIMVTGSHNPPEYNGFKLSVGKETIFGEDIQQVRKLIEEASFPTASPGSRESFDIVSAYREEMVRRFGYLSRPEYRRLKVVVDAGNGTAGLVVPSVLEVMGCDVFSLYCDPDGRFPNHHPDPTVVEYVKDLIRVTQEEEADLGVGYDGDSDRIGVVKKDGKIVWGDQVMIILSRDILKRSPGATFIGDVKCSQAMFDDIGRNGGRAVMWKTGHSLVKAKMRQERAVLAGEFSGHIFIGDDYYGFDDALYTTFRLVEILKKTGKGIDELLEGVPDLRFTPEIRLECPDRTKKVLIEKLLKRLEEYRASGTGPIPIREIDSTDGARVVFEKGWGLARSSNTQPVVVLRFEAEDEESLIRYRAFIENEIDRAMSSEQ